MLSKFVGNKGKMPNSKWVVQENKAHQIFWKTNSSYPLTLTRTCAYQGIRNVYFSKNLVGFLFLQHPFWDSPFCLITNKLPISVSFYACNMLRKIEYAETIDRSAGVTTLINPFLSSVTFLFFQKTFGFLTFPGGIEMWHTPWKRQKTKGFQGV